MDIGFIGLGRMGHGIAERLLKAGHRLVVYNRTRSKADDLAKAGARVADRPADVCCGEAVITMLTGDEALAGMLTGRDGALPAMAEGQIHISMSTISVALAEHLARAHADAGQSFVSAPVLGRPDMAAAGKLFVVAAGPPEAVRRCQAVFDAIGQKTFMLGDTPSAANTVKLAINFLISAMLESLGEACALMRKSDIDPHRFIEVATQTLFAAPAYKTYGTMIADRAYEPVGFPMAMGLKDVRLALAAADSRQVPMPVASLVRDHFLAGVATGHAGADWATLAELCAAEAGLR